MYKKTTLKNGLRIITVPLKNTRAATVLVLVGTGSKYETKENNGISHFLEHMFFKGTKKRPNTLALSETLDRVGGMYNAFTGTECTGFWAKVDSNHLDLALDWVSDILLNSKLEAKKIEKEKGVIVEEINMYLDAPQKYIYSLWQKLLYGDQPAGWDIAGEKKVITKFKRRDFLNYFKNQYVAQNTIVCVGGNLGNQDMLKKIKKHFSKVAVKSSKQKLKVVEKQTQPCSIVYYKKTDQTHLLLGTRGYDIFHPQRYALALLSIILGGSMSSRLWISVREKQGLAYYVRTFVNVDTDTGYLTTKAGVNNNKVEQVITSILKEYQQIRDKKITKGELQKAKDYSKGRMSLSLESSNAQVSFHAQQELLTQEILTLKEKFARIDKVTLNDIQKVAQDIFQPSKLNLAIIGPFKNKKQFDHLLKL